MTDREILELAAKAAGISLQWGNYTNSPDYMSDGYHQPWNPLIDDGDALRLAVELGISITPYPIYNENERHSVIAKQRRKSDTMRETNPTEVVEIYGGDPCAATRRAIVRAAAEVGKGMLTYEEFVLMFPGRCEEAEVELAAAEIGREME